MISDETGLSLEVTCR